MTKAQASAAAPRAGAAIAGCAWRWLRPRWGRSVQRAPRSGHSTVGCGRLGHKRALLAVARHISEIAYHLLARRTTYRDLGTDYFDRLQADKLKRRSLAQLQRLGYQVTLTSISTSAASRSNDYFRNVIFGTDSHDY